MADTPELWVFGYGSLLFNPGIEVADRREAILHGYRRRFCMWSIHHRGSEDAPGLVLALEPHEGASCAGIAFRAAAPEAALASLRERELISSAYHERQLELETPDGPLRAVAYVIDPAHRQYAPDLTLERQAEIIARASGGQGPNREYLHRTAEALTEAGISDPEIQRLAGMVP